MNRWQETYVEASREGQRHMLVKTERFGEITVTEEEIIHFPEGILGFEELRRFLLVDRGNGSEIRFLQALDDPSIAFAVIDPQTFRPDYVPQLWDEDRTVLNCDSDADLSVLAILTVPQDVREMTANLMAPVIVNTKERLGRQVVQGLGEYSTRHRIIDEMERAQRLLRTKGSGSPRAVKPETAEESLRQTV